MKRTCIALFLLVFPAGMVYSDCLKESAVNSLKGSVKEVAVGELYHGNYDEISIKQKNP